MKKNKGFTLIELLAVIVVLAVIALIATPIVLKLVNNAKEGAAESSATAYIKAVENGIMAKLIKEPDTSFNGIFTVSQDKTKIISESGVEINVDVKGNLPAQGSVVTIDDNGTVTSATFNISNYEIECTNDKCKVKGKKVQEEEEISYPSVLEKAKTLVYDENGVCKTDGTTYNYMGGCYIKGANTSNYVWYNGFMWRIMGINSDNTVRLITDENVTTLSYGPENSALTYATNEGYIHDWLNEYFYNNLNSTKSIIQEGAYFCSESTNEKKLTEGRQTCTSGSEVTTKVGIISYDEILLAGGASSYLYIAQDSWTMTPYDSSTPLYFDYRGNVLSGEMTYNNGVRPIINVRFNANVTTGDGSTNSFYVLEENKTSSIIGNLNKKSTIGEYVKLEGKLYRIVAKYNHGTKIILDDFYEEKTVFGSSYSEDFNTNEGAGKLLNTDILAWLGLSNSDKIVETTYYQGDELNMGEAYYDSLEEKNGVVAKVGLIQMGDILANHSSTMLTKNYTTSSSYSNVKDYWTITKHPIVTNFNVWRISEVGSAYNSSKGGAKYYLRPVITVSIDLDIISGTGTWKNPYEI